MKGRTKTKAETPIMGKWIPCSERLPEKGVDVIVQCDYPSYMGVGVESYIGKQRCGSPNDSELYHTWETSDGFDDCSVVAWMPLPEPCKEIARACMDVDKE